MTHTTWVLDPWWVLDILYGLMCFPPLKLRPINNNDCKSQCMQLSIILHKMIANVIVGRGQGRIKQDDWIEITVVSPCLQSPFDLPEWGGEKVSLPESHQTFGIAAAQTTGPILFSLFKLVFLSVASIYWQTNGYNQASCSKRAAITVVSKQDGNHQSSAVYLICTSWSLATLEPPSFKGPLAPWLSDSHLLFQSWPPTSKHFETPPIRSGLKNISQVAPGTYLPYMLNEDLSPFMQNLPKYAKIKQAL